MSDQYSTATRDNIIWLIKKIIHELFSLSLILYLILFIVEEINPNFVSNFMNLRYWLILVVASGLLTVVTKSDQKVSQKTDHENNYWCWLNYVIALILGIISGVVIYYKL